MIWHDPDKFFFDDSDVPDTNVGEFAKDTDVPSKLVTNQNRLTNADRIRAMSDEELAEFLEGEYGNMLPNTALDWLKSPVEVEE